MKKLILLLLSISYLNVTFSAEFNNWEERFNERIVKLNR